MKINEIIEGDTLSMVFLKKQKIYNVVAIARGFYLCYVYDIKNRKVFIITDDLKDEMIDSDITKDEMIDSDITYVENISSKRMLLTEKYDLYSTWKYVQRIHLVYC